MFDIHVLPGVRQRIQEWLGEPDTLLSNALEYRGLTSNFASLKYARKHTLSVSLGASAVLIPQSRLRYSGSSGMRHEYILHHADMEHADHTAANILKALALFPLYTDRFISSGSAIYLGGGLRILKNDSPQYIYLTDPYEDDPRIYSPHPYGQVEMKEYTVQFLWAIPIHESEYKALKELGPEEFEGQYLKPSIDYADWNRKPSI